MSPYQNKGVFTQQARRIFVKRQLLRWNQKTLAKISQTSITTISRLERGTSPSEYIYRVVESVLDTNLQSKKKELLTYYREKLDKVQEIINYLDKI